MEATLFNQLAVRIIKEQENIIGPLAWQEAAKVQGLKVIDSKTNQIDIEMTSPKTVINGLVARYEQLFGKMSREVCREAVGDLTAEIPADELPESLR